MKGGNIAVVCLFYGKFVSNDDETIPSTNGEALAI